METVKVNVKWGKKKYTDVEVDLSEVGVVFKTQLYTLTRVPVERQKIMGCKGGLLKDDTLMSTVGLKNGSSIMLMGTSEDDSMDIVRRPTEKVVFVEDLAPEEMQHLVHKSYPAGLFNLGNTCYMNASIQFIKSVPEIIDSLEKYPGNASSLDSRERFVTALKDVVHLLHTKNTPVSPLIFLTLLRDIFPQFAEKNEAGVFRQQDAEECFTQLITVLQQKVKAVNSNTNDGDGEDQKVLNTNVIQEFFSGKMKTTLKCIDSEAIEAGEQVTTTTDSFTKLTVHIDATTNFLVSGLKASLNGHLSKNCTLLGREADYEKSSLISELPKYLSIQFVRFFWKPQQGVRAKIVRPVDVPLVLDVSEFCTPELQEQLLIEKRRQHALKDIEDNKDKEEKILENEENEENEDNLNANLNKNKKSGNYELISVLSHQGMRADGGHYVAWIKNNNEEWYKFDDDAVSMVSSQDIVKLSGKGGGDWHIAYLCLYRSI